MHRPFVWLAAGSLTVCLGLSAAAQTKSVPGGEPSATAADRQDSPIDFDRARALLRRRQRGEKLDKDEEAYLTRAIETRRKQGQRGGQPAAVPRDSIGQKPLTELTASDRYKGEDGGLYGQGRNTPPEPQLRAAKVALSKINPLDAAGQPAAEGRIVFVSISMSNATQEFSRFKRLADADTDKSSQVTIVDCAQGGQAMAEWVNPQAGPWREAERRIAAAGVTPQQVQVAWIKLANKGPRGDLKEHGRQLQRDTQAVIQNAKAKFPQLQIAYLSSRIYGGYAAGALNPEPYAYESAFAVRWLIQDQIQGAAALNSDEQKGAVKAPLLLWGPYLWADGTTPRVADQLVYTRDDLAGDGTHPSESGRDKVAKLMLTFFKTDPLAKPWFAR